MKRLKQSRNLNKKSILFLKLLSTFYLCFSMMAYLSSSTNASFNDVEEVNMVLSVGNWEIEDPPDEEKGCSEKHDGWDCSSLEFVNSGYEVLENGLIRIYAELKNNSENDMKNEGKSFVYFNEKGNPKKGEKIGPEIKFNPIPAGVTITIEYIEALSPGNYMFLAYQSAGHPGKGELWSDPSIEVPEVNNTENTEPTPDEINTEEKNEQEEPTNDEDQESKDNSGQPVEETVVETP
ncbi:amyloid fiber anchoring/assembly protein TapA, partial [Bacillus sp. RO3]|nr:amyloid fiber anchoring/assembly protein TapA [Bacillus sp. RO3]